MIVVKKKGWFQYSCQVQVTFELTSSSDEDETAELMRELEKIKRERAEQKEKEVNRLVP